MDVEKLLSQVKDGTVSVKEAAAKLKREPYEDLGYARLDTHREVRSGFPEVVFCSGKEDKFLTGIYQKMMETEGEAFGTRASQHQYEIVRQVVPDISYDPVSRILKYEKPGRKRSGKVAVCTAGTADIPVAEEAAQTAEYFGCAVDRIYDVGVSGLHRLLAKLDEIQSANCVIAVAGMEGALASVIGGLVSCPVIAVPTSVGYGASMGGLSALLTMINSCANGISVVNIDNGYGAGYLATQINRLAEKIPEKSGEQSGEIAENTDKPKQSCRNYPDSDLLSHVKATRPVGDYDGLPVNSEIHAGIGRFDVVLDQVEAGGREYPFSYVNMRDSVGILLTTRDGFVCLENEYRHAVKKWCLEIPCGGMEDHESPAEAAARELKEETGITVLPEDLHPLGRFYPSFGCTTEAMYLFHAAIDKTAAELAGSEGESRPEPLEKIKRSFIPVKKFKTMIKDGTMENASAIVAWYRYARAVKHQGK